MSSKDKFRNYHQDSESLIGNSFPARLWLRTVNKFPSLNKKIAIVLGLPQNAKVLDVGCGIGTFLKQINQVRPDLKLYGIDVSPDLKDKIPNYVNYEQASGDKIPHNANTFDLVISQHVLEHVQNPEDFVKEFKRVSKDYVIVACPNYKKTFIWDSNNFWSDYTHVRPFTKTSMRKILESQGLKLESVKNTRDINVPLPGILLLMIYSLFSRKFKFKNVCANIVKYTTVGVARK